MIEFIGAWEVKLKHKLTRVIKMTENRKKRFAHNWSFSALKPRTPI